MKIKKAVFAGLLFGFLSQMGLAQQFDKTKLDNYFNALEAGNKFMGSVAISKDGAVIYSKTVGFADLENNIKADAGSRYRIGSISKTFTAVLVLKAVELGKLDLDQTIDKYFSGMQHTDRITVAHLLQHRSGIHNFTDDKEYLGWNTVAKTKKEMLDIIAKAGSDFEPDSKAAYSNSNYVLLTFILENVYAKPYAELVQEYIARPCGLKNTYLGGKINPAVHESKSYSMRSEWQVEVETDMSIPLGAGGIVSTPADLVKFSDALFTGKLLRPESLERMKTVSEGYGMGLFGIPFYGKTGYGHTGGIDGFSSVFSYFADGNISYALTSNGTNFNNNDISIAVLSAVFDKPYEIPVFSGYTPGAEELDQYLGVYVSGQIPLKVTITKDNNTLIAQATGQPAFPLEAVEKGKFKFDRAGLALEFNPAEKAMLLKQGGAQFMFVKE